MGATWPPLWPIPASFSNGTIQTSVNSIDISMTISCQKSSDLLDGFSRFLAKTFPHATGSPNGTSLDAVVVCLANASVPLQLYIDESYQLSITASQILINCNTVYGCYHAFETLSQLVDFDYDTQQYSIFHAPWHIVDAPRFPHRGLLVDSSRHYLPVLQLKGILDSLTFAKLNTLHWHIVDAISFPFDSPSYKNLSKFGAYSPKERYTTSDVSEVVEYARKRGIRVMVELDTPGHSGAMCFGLPDICPVPACTSSNINNWALDITKNLTYVVIGSLLQDLSSLFPEKLTHLGGDEVDTYCWSLHPYIMQWLADRGLTLDGGYEYYVKRVQAIAWGLNREVVGWQEIWDHFGTQLNIQTIIHQWLADSVALPLNVTSHGYRLIWSDSSVWYLDHLSVSWQTMYNAEPCNGLPEKNCQLILGGEGCMWGETVDTSDGQQTIWPRLAAIAERLWSPQQAAQLNNNTLERITAFRCLLNDRGVAAAPVQNPAARQAPPGPGSCFRQ